MLKHVIVLNWNTITILMKFDKYGKLIKVSTIKLQLGSKKHPINILKHLLN